MNIEDKITIGTFAIALIMITAIAWPKNIVIVQGSSMEPFLADGCIVSLTVGKANITTGDVIVFTLNNISMIHRVVGFCEGGYITKGDNNWGHDGCVPNSSVSAKMLYGICYNGVKNV